MVAKMNAEFFLCNGIDTVNTNAFIFSSKFKIMTKTGGMCCVLFSFILFCFVLFPTACT